LNDGFVKSPAAALRFNFVVAEGRGGSPSRPISGTPAGCPYHWICAPCIWSFLRNQRPSGFLRNQLESDLQIFEERRLSFHFQKQTGACYFDVRRGARGQRRASRNHEALVFPLHGAEAAGLPPLFAETHGVRRLKRGSRPVLSRSAPLSPRPIEACILKAKSKK
jgi:hypothetical protein